MASSNNFDEQKTTALVLSGGGAKGAFQVGALEMLREAGFTFDTISGMSVGSLNGAMLASDQLDTLIQIWHDITTEKVYRKHSLVSLAWQYLSYKIGTAEPPVSRYHNEPLQQLMEHYLLGKKVTRPFHFGYVKLESGVFVKATIRRTGGHTIDRADLKRLLASTAIPVYFNPSYIVDSTCVDGGLRNMSPIAEVLPYKPDRLVLIPTKPVDVDPEGKKARDILEIALRSISIILDEVFEEDIERFLDINRLVRQAEAEGITLTRKDGTPYKYVEPIIVAPKEPLGDELDFENSRMQQLIELGRNRAKEILRGIS